MGPGSPALLRELGVPAGVAVHVWRPPRAWWEAKDRRLDPCEENRVRTYFSKGEKMKKPRGASLLPAEKEVT
jgi:hypothetical protein